MRKKCAAESSTMHKEKRDILILYAKAIGYVLIAYAAMAIGYLPVIIGQATDAVALMQETLEIGAYKPVIVTAPSISSGLFYTYRLQNSHAKRNTPLIEILKSCLQSGVVAVLGFNIYWGMLMGVLPIMQVNPVEQFSGAPHSSIYKGKTLDKAAVFCLLRGRLSVGSICHCTP